MRHATEDDLAHLGALLSELRQFSALRERKLGYFSRGGRAFCHFHADGSEFYVDAKLAGAFRRFRVTGADEQAHFLSLVREALERHERSSVNPLED